MADHHPGRVNVYDADGRVIDARPRREAKASGLAVGAVHVLLMTSRRDVLLQRRPDDKENGGLWDKSVGGHVDAGEEFDVTAVREAGEELFDDGASSRVRLASGGEELSALAASLDLSKHVVFRRVAFQTNLRDVRHAPNRGGTRTVLYHVAVYAGRTDVPLQSFHPQAAEIAELGYFSPERVDAMLLAGVLAPNMAFLWLTQAASLLALAEAS